MTIRPAVESDALALAPMFRCEAETQRDLSGAFQLAAAIDWTRYARLRIRRGRACVLVAEEGSEVLGFADSRLPEPQRRPGLRARIRAWIAPRTEQASLASRAPRGFIESIYVAPEHRRRGVATALVEQASRWLVDSGATSIEASVWSANSASMAMMRKAGFLPLRVIVQRGARPPAAISG